MLVRDDQLAYNGHAPDLATIFSLIASHTNNPSPGHLDAVKHLGRYIKSTADLGLLFSSRRNVQLESYVHFPVNDVDDLSNGGTAPSISGFCDANWGPQDASLPSTFSTLPIRSISLSETRSICGHVLMMGVLLCFGNATKKNVQVEVLLKPRLRLLMSARRVYKCLEIFLGI